MLAPFCPPRGAHVYCPSPTVATLPYIKVAPRVILSPPAPLAARLERWRGLRKLRPRQHFEPCHQLPVCPKGAPQNKVVAPRVILSPARPRFGGWSKRQGKGAQAPLTLAARSSSPPRRPSAPPKGATNFILLWPTYFSLLCLV